METKTLERNILKEMKKEAENARVDYVISMAGKIAKEICPHLNRKSFIWRRGATIIVIAYDEYDTNSVFIYDEDVLICVKTAPGVSHIEFKPVRLYNPDNFIDAEKKNKAVTNVMRFLDENYENIVKEFVASLSNK